MTDLKQKNPVQYHRLSSINTDNRVLPEVSEQRAKVILHKCHVKNLEKYYTEIQRLILRYQGCTLGLFPAIGNKDKPEKVAYVRDSIYCAVASWALSQAFRRIDDDMGKAEELSYSAIKCMRGILYCWLRQADKVENFKQSQSAMFALHCKFDLVTGDPVSGDCDGCHFQIDVVALYIIFLVQMIHSGLQVIFTTDEVNFIQNLVFYMERAYRTPDYGMWERGTKYNNGSMELHASSIGMVKAALESVSGVNLFGDQGASWSVIYVDIDAHNRNRTIFETILPRESNSKNTDASLIPTICWPAFAIHERIIKDHTIDKIGRKLLGNYGIKRFLRDGYCTVVEDKNRKFYRPAEIKTFDGVESEWPMFYAYMIIHGFFCDDDKLIDLYSKKLDGLLIYTPDGLVIPKYYYVPSEHLVAERVSPGSQRRLSSFEGSSECIFLWGQAVYIISQLIVNKLLSKNELDPIRRHLVAADRPRVNMRYSSFQLTPSDLVVQIVLVSESMRLQQLLATYGIESQTPHQLEPIQIWAPGELTKAYTYLGWNSKLGLSGRPSRPFGVLSTSKMYRACGKTVLCYPLLFENSDFYLAQDLSLVIDDLRNDIAFLTQGWKLRGRPIYCMLLRENTIRGAYFHKFLELLSELRQGECNGVSVKIARLQTLVASSCLEHLDFLHNIQDTETFIPFEERVSITGFKSLTEIPAQVNIVDSGGISYEDYENRSSTDLVTAYMSNDSLAAKSQLLHILLKREGSQFYVKDIVITEKLEKLINRASARKQWHVVRFCSALLHKVVDSLAPSITSILVRGKQITLGVFGHEEEVIDTPLSPDQIKAIIYRLCMPYDIVQAVLQQELIIGIGKLIATSPQHFTGILKIRIGWFIHAMQVELNHFDHDTTNINSLSPNDVKLHLWTMLHRDYLSQDNRSAYERRLLDGSLNRVPKDFYDRVWQTLERTPTGMRVAGYLLPQQPTLSDMTMYELNFSVLVEQMLSKIAHPAYRQIMVEAFMVVSTILERNEELMFKNIVDMDKFIEEAVDVFWSDQKAKPSGDADNKMDAFYRLSPNISGGTTPYIAKVITRHLLDGNISTTAVDSCVVT